MEFRTCEFNERRKGRKRCECPIFASGTLNRISPRQNTGQWEWEPAKLIAAKLETFGRWDGSNSEPPPIINQSVATTNHTTIKEATQTFLVRCENRGIALPTFRKYQTFVRQLHSYCDGKG